LQVALHPWRKRRREGRVWFFTCNRGKILRASTSRNKPTRTAPDTPCSVIVLIAITSSSRWTNGPPELPGLIRKSPTSTPSAGRDPKCVIMVSDLGVSARSSRSRQRFSNSCCGMWSNIVMQFSRFSRSSKFA